MSITTMPKPDSTPPQPVPDLKDLEQGPASPTDTGVCRRHRRDKLVPRLHQRPAFKPWIRRNWLDILTQLFCLSTALAIYRFVPPLTPRYFPLYRGIEHSEFGRRYGQPFLKEYIDTLLSAIVSFVVPLLIMVVLGLWGVRDFEDQNTAIMGLGYALATSTLFQSFLKVLIGGLRPHFLTLCAPNIAQLNREGRLAFGDNRFYTATQVCTGDLEKIREAQMSFPSGHAVAAFAGFGFLALWFNAKFKVFGRGRKAKLTRIDPMYHDEEMGSTPANTKGSNQGRIQHWKLVLFAAPWCIAILIAGSKVRDAWHHPVDVCAGALLGTAFAHMAFRMVYRSVYDWRSNHVSMERRR